jgi:membrane protease YdiL (CAAX protease family)
VVLGVAIWACLAVWVAVANRRRRGLPVLPYQPRRQVPWRVLDLLAMLAIYLALQAAALLLVHAWLGPQLTRPPHIYNLQQTSTQNIAVKLLEHPEPSVLLCCGLAVVVVAPIVEEFLYRVLLQGWLEAAQRRYRRAMPTLRRLLPGAVGPVFLSSFLFARAHFRTAAPAMNVYYVTLLLVGNMLASLLTMGLAIGLLRLRVRASAADFGWVPEKFLADVRLGLLAFVAVAAPVYMLQIALSLSLPKYFAPDPFTLFVFALALGTLYYRTHRIVPAIVVHMSLNATTMAMALLSGCV